MSKINKEYEKIKEVLLKDYNILRVDVDSKKRIVYVVPLNINYKFKEEPLENFMNDFHIIINNHEFRIKQLCHSNSRISLMQLKEVYC